MATMILQTNDWHSGERRMHQLLHVEDITEARGYPPAPTLSAQAAAMLQRAPLLAVGTLDNQGRPWTSLWGGEKGLSRPVTSSIIGVRTPVASRLDPVVEILVGQSVAGEVAQGEDRMVSALPIDLETRKRVKIYGRMVAGALGRSTPDGDKDAVFQGELQLAVDIKESLGNCPKYINRKSISAAQTAPKLVSEALPLPVDAIDLISKTDVFFLSTVNGLVDMDTNHRGGPPGFVRIQSNDEKLTVLVYPEYSGNRMYQSLGNMITTPVVGICVPDFFTGACLYLTGLTEILVGEQAANVIQRSNLAVRVTVTAARLVSGVLPFRGTAGEASPYNPVVRPLASESRGGVETVAKTNRARLLRQVRITPDISRFVFALTNAMRYNAGQYVTVDLSEHMDIGYSHMRDDDPRSLNEDFVRTFTVSSPPGQPPDPSTRLADDEFEITIRKVGLVTGFLFEQGLPGKQQEPFEIGVKGFGGEFDVVQDERSPVVAFVAAGVGITPLLPCLGQLSFASLHVLWTMRAADVPLAVDMVEQHPGLGASLRVFVTDLTGSSEENEAGIPGLVRLRSSGVSIDYRRMNASDVEGVKVEAKRWYVCTGVAQRRVVLGWLPGQETVFEDYNF